MPTIRISYNDFTELVGKRIEKDNLEELLLKAKCVVEKIEGDEWTIEVTPDRLDHFCTEGISRTIKGLIGKEIGLREFKTKLSDIVVEVDQSAKELRPFIMSAVVTGLNLNNESIIQMMQIQDKLHEGIGQKRKLIAMGTYDLDKIKGRKIYYKAMNLRDIIFTPLGCKEEMNGKEILEKTEQGKRYRNLIKGNFSTVLIDSGGNIFSMPPIVNSEDTRVSEETKNIFIDVTGMSKVRVEDTIIILSTSLFERGSGIEWVKVVEPNSSSFIIPNIENRQISIVEEDVEGLIGIRLEKEKIVNLLESLRYGVELKEGKISVKVPLYRRDVFGKPDIIEDIAIAYGYDNIPLQDYPLKTFGKRSERKDLEWKIRIAMVGMEFQEIVSPFLCSLKAANYWNYTGHEILELDNPSIEGYEVVRPSLIPGLILSLKSSIASPLPHKIFEIGRVATRINSNLYENTNVACAISDDSVDFGEGHKNVYWLVKKVFNREIRLEELNFRGFIDGRSAKIYIQNNLVGVIGEVNPEYLLSEGIRNPVVVWELNLSQIVNANAKKN